MKNVLSDFEKTSFWDHFSKKFAIIHEKTFRHWMFRSLCVISVFVVFGIAVYNIAMATAKQTVLTARNGAIQQAGELLDQKLVNVQESISMLTSNETIVSAAYIGEPENGKDFYSYHTAGKECRGLLHYGNVSDIFVYYGKGNCFVGGYQIYYDNMVESFIQQHFEMTQEEWIAYIQSNPFGGICKLGNRVYCWRPMQGLTSLQGILITEINSEELKMLINPDMGQFINCSDGYIINETNDVIASISNIDEPIYKYGELKSGANFIANNVVTCYRMKSVNWEYISIIPLQQYIHEIYRLRVVLCIYIIVCVIVGMWITYFETKIRYRPIQSINQTLNRFESKKVAEDSLTSLQKKVSMIMENNQEMQSILKRTHSALINDNFTNWIHGQYTETEVQKLLKSEFGMEFNEGIVIYVNVLKSVENDIQPDKLTDMLLICLNNIVSELLGNDSRCFFWNYDGILGFIWTDSDIDQIENSDVLESVRRNMNLYFNIELRFSVSKKFSEVANITLAYREAKVTSDYCNLAEQNGIVLYADSLMKPFSAWKNKAIIMAENEFTVFMMDRNYSRAKVKMESIIDYYKSTDGISLQLLRCRMFGLINLMMDAISMGNIDNEIWDRIVIEYPKRLLQANSIFKLEDELMNILEELISYNAEGNESIVEKIDLIDRYIENHYNDQSLSVQLLADKFSLSVPYLSSMYKQTRQVGVLNKIQQCRVKRAKELLIQEPEMSLAQIADKIGYSNVQTMIRVFKKFENETPGRYREVNLKK